MVGDRLALRPADGGHDPLAARMLGQVRRRAAKLIAAFGGDMPVVAEIRDEAERFAELVAGEIDAVAAAALELWELSVVLGNHLEASRVAAVRNPMGNERLTGAQETALRNFLEVSAPFVRLFPDARRLDEEREGSARIGFDREAHLALIRTAVRVEVLVAADGALMLRLAEITGAEGVPGDKARAVTRVGTRNLSSVLAAAAGGALKYGGLGALAFAGGVVGGASDKIGADIADHFRLGAKAVEYFELSREQIEALADDLPPDLRATLRSPLERVEEARPPPPDP